MQFFLIIIAKKYEISSKNRLTKKSSSAHIYCNVVYYIYGTVKQQNHLPETLYWEKNVDFNRIFFYEFITFICIP